MSAEEVGRCEVVVEDVEECFEGWMDVERGYGVA